MRKKFLLMSACMAFALTAIAQYPSMGSHVVSGISTVDLRYTGSDRTKCEIPPWIIPGGWRTYFMVDGWQTWIFSSPASLVDNSEIDFRNNGVGPYLGASPYWKDPNYSTTNPVDHWRRIYYNIYSAHYLAHPTQGGISLAYLAAENKNFVDGNCSSNYTFNRYLNTINPTIGIDCSNHLTWAGGTPFVDGGHSYYGLATAAWTHNNAQTNWGQQYFGNSLGPIVWPSNGYVNADNTNASLTGVGINSSIIADDYIYIFFSDNGLFNFAIGEDGRNRGIRVMRVLKNDALDPTQYRVYYKDPSGNVSWNPSLPAGLTKDNMLNYVKTRGPQGTAILSNAGNVHPTMRFSVAKVINTNYYVGVEEYIDNNDPCPPSSQSSNDHKHKVALRFSTDLINWSDRDLHITGGCWDIDFRLKYPILLNKNGWTNTEVDLEDFYVLGTQGINKSVNKVRVYIPPPPPEPPPPPPIECPPHMPHCEQPYRTGPGKLLTTQTFVFPNPVRTKTKVQFSVLERNRVSISMYDANGRFLGKLDDRLYEQGTYNKEFDMSSKSAGLYFLQITIGEATKHFKIIKQ